MNTDSEDAMAKKAFAIGAHPDDIEFMMAGTICHNLTSL